MTVVNASFRSFATYAPSVATNTYVVPVPAGVQRGDILVMFAILPYNGAVQPTIPAPPAGWTLLWQENIGPTSDPTQGAFTSYAAFRRSVGGEPASYTFNGSQSDRPVAIMVAVKDATDTDPLIPGPGSNPAGGNVAVTNTPGTAYTSPTITPDGDNAYPLVTNGALAVGLFGTFAGSTTGLVIQSHAPYTDYEYTANPANGAAILISGYTQPVQAALNATAACSVSKGRSSGILAFMATWFSALSITRVR